MWFPLGTDGYGRDVFSRVLYGAQVSLLAGVLAAMLSLGIGWTLGTAAGFFGSWVDQLLMRTSEFLMALPWLYLLLGRAGHPAASCERRPGILAGDRHHRLRRVGSSGAAGARGGIERAGKRVRSGGARLRRVFRLLIRRHVAPLTWGVLVTQATVLIPQYILAEVTLSFLGLGVGEPAPSWGNMLVGGAPVPCPPPAPVASGSRYSRYPRPVRVPDFSGYVAGWAGAGNDALESSSAS